MICMLGGSLIIQHEGLELMFHSVIVRYGRTCHDTTQK